MPQDAASASLATEDGREIPEDCREFLICQLRPLIPRWKDHAAPFTEDYKIMRGKTEEGHYRLFLPEDLLRSLISN